MQLLAQALRLTGALSLVLLPMVAGLVGWRAAIGLASGMLWALANVWVIRLLVAPLGSSHGRRWWKTAGLFVLKVPVLYTLGAFLLLSPWSSPVGFLIGFTLWFAALGLSAVRSAAA